MLLTIIYTKEQANEVLYMMEPEWKYVGTTTSQDAKCHRVMFNIPESTIEENKEYLQQITDESGIITYILDISENN